MHLHACVAFRISLITGCQTSYYHSDLLADVPEMYGLHVCARMCVLCVCWQARLPVHTQVVNCSVAWLGPQEGGGGGGGTTLQLVSSPIYLNCVQVVFHTQLYYWE